MLRRLEHVIDPLVTLRKAASFLEKNGVLIVQVPNAHAVNRKIAVLMGTLSSCEELSPFDLHVAGHRRSYTIAALIDDVIDPRETRPTLIRALEMARTKKIERPWKKHGVMPV